MPSLVPRLGWTAESEFLANESWCYTYEGCKFDYAPCNPSQQHYDLRYNDSSAAWVLTASIIVFFMKAGFMLIEVAFCTDASDKRRVIFVKQQDAFASALGFFLFGFLLSNYSSSQDTPYGFFEVTDPVLWFFKFTFASNAATIVGGCLLNGDYKMRIPAHFISAFVISGCIHPVIARLIWSDACQSLFSPYRFCNFGGVVKTASSCGHNCTTTENMDFFDRIYILDFAGGGAVHLLGGVAGLMLVLFAKLQKKYDQKYLQESQERKSCWEQCIKKRNRKGMEPTRLQPGTEGSEQPADRGFWLWMYDESGGKEKLIAEAGLGVMILWFCWFAFNCGSTESVEITRNAFHKGTYPYYGIPGVIAINMIMAVAAGGTLAVMIGVGVQVWFNTESVNPNELANGILSALVAITAGCPFVEFWAACIIGILAVLFYHGGCWLEYYFELEDDARVFPVHGVCGFWSVVAVGLFVNFKQANCNMHATFEGLCYCELRLPPLAWYEHIIAQLLGAVLMLAISALGILLIYGTLFMLPIKWWCYEVCSRRTNQPESWKQYNGGLLLTSRVRYDHVNGQDQPGTNADDGNGQDQPGTNADHGNGQDQPRAIPQPENYSIQIRDDTTTTSGQQIPSSRAHTTEYGTTVTSYASAPSRFSSEKHSTAQSSSRHRVIHREPEEEPLLDPTQ